MTREYDFESMLKFSRGQRERTDIDTLMCMISGAQDCVKTSEREDRGGIDYVVTLRGGCKVNIDAKTRAAECSKYWKNREPEFALEKWSVKPQGDRSGKVGWTLNESSNVDLILFTFDPVDTERCFLYPFQIIRMAFRRYIDQWWKLFQHDEQASSRNGTKWNSECVFVPHGILCGAMDQVTEGRLFLKDGDGMLQSDFGW